MSKTKLCFLHVHLLFTRTSVAAVNVGEKRPRGRPKGSLNRPKEPGAQTQKKKRKSSGPPALMTALSSATREQLVSALCSI